jgi:hypothetical protein
VNSVTVIERLDLRERIDDLGKVRRVLSEQSDQNGYDSSLAHAIKRLDQAIGYLWSLDAASASPKSAAGAEPATSPKSCPQTQ